MSEFPTIEQAFYRELAGPLMTPEGVVMLNGIVPLALREGEVNLDVLEERRQEIQDNLSSRRMESDAILDPLIARSRERLPEFMNVDLVKRFFDEQTMLAPSFDRILLIDNPQDLQDIAMDSRVGEEVSGIVGSRSYGDYLEMLDVTVLLQPNIFDVSVDRTFYEATLVYMLAKSCVQSTFKNHFIVGQNGLTNMVIPTQVGMATYRLKDALGSNESQSPIGTFYNDSWIEHMAGKYRGFKRETAPQECSPYEMSGIEKCLRQGIATAEDAKYIELNRTANGTVGVGYNSDQAYAAMALERLDSATNGELLPALSRVMVDNDPANQLVVARLINRIQPGLHRQLMLIRNPGLYPRVLQVAKMLTTPTARA